LAVLKNVITYFASVFFLPYIISLSISDLWFLFVCLNLVTDFRPLVSLIFILTTTELQDESLCYGKAIQFMCYFCSNFRRPFLRMEQRHSDVGVLWWERLSCWRRHTVLNC